MADKTDYIYKIYTVEIQVPSSFPTSDTNPLPNTPLDETSGYLHLCNEHQVQKVLTRFFKNVPEVIVLKLATKDINPELLKWEEVLEKDEQGNEIKDSFPHFYGQLHFNQVVAKENFINLSQTWSRI